MTLHVQEWLAYPSIAMPSPVTAVAVDDEMIFAAGLGGVAFRQADDARWQPHLNGLRLNGVTTLAWAGPWLIAGGVDGVARSRHGSAGWQTTVIEGQPHPVAALGVSPNFAEDLTILAGTLGGGILRSDDAGRAWIPANFGLEDAETTALLWIDAETVLAGAPGGLYLSPNGGRAWRLIDDEIAPVAALVHHPDGVIFAALETGELLISDDEGSSWDWLDTDLPTDAGCNAFFIDPATGVCLIGTGADGIWRSADGGSSWQQAADAPVFCFGAHGATLLAGTALGLLSSVDEGRSWQIEPQPPIHGLGRLFITQQDTLLVTGVHSPPARWDADVEHWQMLPLTPLPLTALTQNSRGMLVAGHMSGLSYSEDEGIAWSPLLENAPNNLTQLVFRDSGRGWAGSADGRYLMISRDDGDTWQALNAPFGVLQLAALEAGRQILFGVTYDARNQVAQLWRSMDGGREWLRGATVETPWPIVATCRSPLLLTLGDVFFVAQDADTWVPLAPHLGNIRRVAGVDDHIFALTTTGLYHSADRGLSWRPVTGLPAEQVLLDIATNGEQLFVLTWDGHVFAAQLEPLP